MDISTHVYDDYIASLFAPQDSILDATIAEMERESIPGMNVSAVEGKLLQLLALMVGAKRVLEIGTLGGYSGIHFARVLPADGQLVTLEIDPHHAAVARRNFERADVAHKTRIHLGSATETLQKLADSAEPLFDVIFIDADKESYTQYLQLSLPLLREGGLLLGDNTLRGIQEQDDSGTMQFNAAVAKRPELTSVVIPILRRRGIDGLTVSLKRTPVS